MIKQKHFIVAIILFGLLLTLPLAEAKLTFPINFRNIFSISSDRVPAPLLSNDRLKVDNSMGQIAFWGENSNLTGDNALFWDNNNKQLKIYSENPEIYRLKIFSGHGFGIYAESNTTIINDGIALYGYNPGPGSSLGIAIKGESEGGKGIYGYGGAIGIYGNTTSGFSGIFMGGNVGIGTTAPVYKLDISGKAYASEGFKLPIVDNGDVGVCDESQEGLVLIKKQDGANLSYRKVIICMQTGDDSFSWESLLSTSWGPYASQKEESSVSSSGF